MRELHPHFRTLVRLLRQYYARSLVELEISIPQAFSLEYHRSSTHPIPKRFLSPDGLSGYDKLALILCRYLFKHKSLLRAAPPSNFWME